MSILGCGWLGLPLGRSLARKGYLVKGTTTSRPKLASLVARDIQPFLLHLDPEPNGEGLADFLSADVLVLNVPPKVEARGADFHPRQIRFLMDSLLGSAIRRVIYISATSVYPDLNREVTEEEALPQPGSNRVLLQAEALLRSLSPRVETTVLRCGGLMGYDRIPGKYFAGRKALPTGAVPVNLVHRDDVVGAVEAVIEREKWGETYNLVAPLHPTRQEVYLRNAADLGFEPPEFTPTGNQPFKIVAVRKLQQELAYVFRYPDPLNFSFTNEDPFY
ncbi:MAG: SDR family oxidoreductase [Ferruginibacter sp.]|nr:SDR family oxidoreductase [Cytophagales bacterium]